MMYIGLITCLIKIIVVLIDLQNRHGKSSEAVPDDTENISEVSSAKGYGLICEKRKNVSSFIVFWKLKSFCLSLPLPLFFAAQSGGNRKVQIPMREIRLKIRERINLRQTSE